MERTAKTSYKYKFSYWHAFLIPLIVMVGGCIGSGIFPFGNQSFLRNDLYNQYMPFFQAFHDKIWQGESLAYSFELGLGSGFAALYGYYLSSPVNWLVALCPRSLIAEFITVLILVKVSLAGTSFAFYLNRHFGKRDMGVLFFSSAYALSGYMAAYQWNIMWLDVVVLAPLVIWALEELVEHGRGSSYCLLLGLAIFTNFYLSIMLCIFLVLYFVILVLSKPLGVLWRRCLQFGMYSLLAGGLAGVVLLPVALALGGREAQEFDFPDTLKWYMSFLEEISRHCINVSMKVQADHWPNIYCGVAIFLLIPLFICNRRIAWRDKLGKLILVAVFLVSFSCNMLDYIWHGLNFPNSLPARQGYLYTWLLLVMAYEVYLKLRYVRWYEIGLAGMVAYGAVITAWVRTDVEGCDTWTYVLTLAFVTVYLALLVGRYLWKRPQVRRWLYRQRFSGLFRGGCAGVKLVVLLLVVAELATNTYLTSIRTVNRTKYMGHFADAQQAVDWLEAHDESLYRTEIFERLTKNDSMMWGINTGTVFSSTVNAGVVDLYKALGMGTTSVSYWHQGATPLASALLGVKYMLGKDATMDNDLYELIYEDETGCIYECRYTLPLGFVVDSDLENSWNLGGYNPVKAQNDLCQLLGAGGALLLPADSEIVDERTRRVTAAEDSYIYVYLGNTSLSEVKWGKEEPLDDDTASQAGAPVDSGKFTQVSFDYFLDLCYMKKGTVAILEVVKEDQEFKTFQPYVLNLEVLGAAIHALSRETLQITEHGSDWLKGRVSLAEPGKLVLSIPNDPGWTLLINGEEREIESFEDALIGVELEAGEHEVELRFETPGAKAGALLSVASAVILASIWGFYRRRKYEKNVACDE